MASSPVDTDVAQAIAAIVAADRLDDLRQMLAEERAEWLRGQSDRDWRWGLASSSCRQMATLLAELTSWPEWRAVAAVREATGDHWPAEACRMICDYAARIDAQQPAPRRKRGAA